MDLQKVKEALSDIEKAMMLDGVTIDNCGDFENGLSAIRYIREAFAELEKPVDSASKCAEELQRVSEKIVLQSMPEIFRTCEDGDRWYEENKKLETALWVPVLQQYAESYHAKKCAECKSKSCKTCKWECAYKKDGSNPCLTCKGGVEIFRNWESNGNKVNV